jgi:xylulokinase
MTKYLLGADVGSSGLKAALVHPERGVVAVAEYSYPMHRPQPGWAENDAEDWYRALAAAIPEVLAKGGVTARDVAGLCLVGQRDVAVLVDENRAVLAPVIHWTDRRDPAETTALYDRLGRDRLIDICGTQPIPGLMLPNLCWTKKHQPEVWSRARYALTPKDYLAHRLTGDVGTDPTGPTRSILNDWRATDWSSEICHDVGISRETLADVRYQPWQIRAILGDQAAGIGLTPGTPLMAGGGDDPSATLGSGVVNPGDVSIGTSSSMSWRVVADKPVHDPSGLVGLMPHLVPDRFIHEMVITGSGTTLRWFRETFAPGSTYEELIAEASKVPAGSEGLVCFPYLEGATVPIQDDHARAVFHGISGQHRRPHFVRAILEGIAFQYPGLLQVIHEHGLPVQRLTTCDGEARSTTWNQIKADIINQPLTPALRAEAPAIGAAMLVGIGSGLFASPAEAIDVAVELAPTIEPDPASAASYDILRHRWENLRAEVFPLAVKHS